MKRSRLLTLMATLPLAVLIGGCEPISHNVTVINASDTARILPNRKQDKDSWANDMHKVFDKLSIPATTQNVCTVTAIIDQESNFSADPAVPNLGASSLAELEQRLEAKLGATLAGVFRQMLTARPSPEDNFAKRMQEVKTERELDELYRTMFTYFADNYKVGRLNNFAKSLNSGIDEMLNPINTLGSMQVHIDYAKSNRRLNMNDDELRDDLYSQYGGLYYGIHRLMLYQAGYDQPIYRFADYNSGMYSSRNAALQAQIAKLAGRKLALDGDLLSYDGAVLAKQAGQTEQAVIDLLPMLNAHLTKNAGTQPKPLDAAQIRKDLKKEKQAGFEDTITYRTIKAVYESKHGTASYATMPKVAINSPKMKGSYDTNWFVTNVNKRYERCISEAKKIGLPLA